MANRHTHTNATSDGVLGNIRFPTQWTVFAPCDPKAPVPATDVLARIPDRLEIEGTTLSPETVTPERGQFDFKPFFGEPAPVAKAAYVFLPLDSDIEQTVTLGLGADWYMKAWVNGRVILDRLVEGNIHSPPSIGDFRVQVQLNAGRNVLAVLFMNGRTTAVLALGGPEELRRGDFESIAPPRRTVVDATSLYELFPPDPEAPIRWIVPATFDPTLPDLGLPHLESAKHEELFHALPSKAAIEEGGTGRCESLRHGTWNHGPQLIPFRHLLIAFWNSHAQDEGGPGSRPLGTFGRVLDEEGNVEWGGNENLFEAAPPAVPVRRRTIESTKDRIRCVQTRGAFCLIEGRLFFEGHLLALHGKASDPARYWAGIIPPGCTIPSESFRFGPDALALGGQNLRWDLGIRFYQEWDLLNGRLQPVSPLYRTGVIPDSLPLTPDLTLPLEPLNASYRDAPPLENAPAKLQTLIHSGRRVRFTSPLPYRPGTSHLTCDGSNGLAHATQFRRPDGSWVAIRENQRPTVQPLYYAAEKPDAESFYPPARRTNLYGAVNPHGGELPDGTVYLIGNSPNRRTMFIVLSRDGRVFDRTWHLLHRQLADYTPGIMKREGGPGAGPQYFHALTLGKSLWIVYSVSKEHIGATRIPLAALQGGKSPIEEGD